MAMSYVPWMLPGAQAEAKPGSTHESGIRYPARLSDRSTPTSKWTDQMQIFELLYRRFSMTMGLHCERTDNELEVAVWEGVYGKSDGTFVTFAGNDAFAVPDDTTGYKLWVLAADNTLYGGASWPADKTTFVAVAEVDTASGAVTAVEDRRGYNTLRIVPTYADNGQTAQSTFTVDVDATVDGDRLLVLQRTAALAAALKWAQSSGWLELYEDKDTSTLAKLNLLEVLISGTALLDSNGAAKVAAAVAGDGLGHSAGVLAVNVDDSTIEIDTDTLQVKDGAVSAAKLEGGLKAKLLAVSVPNGSGAGSATITIQIQDMEGNSVSEVVYLEVGVFDDTDAQAEAANATIADGGAGSFLDAITTNKRYRCKTDSSGQLQVTVTDATPEEVYVCVGPTRRSRLLDCQDYGTVTIT